MKPYNLEIEQEIANCIEDEYGVIYSKDGKLLLECKNKELTHYIIREGTEVICDEAFMGCKALSNVFIPKSVTSIDMYAFLFCTSLAKVTIAEANPHFCIEDGVLYTKDKKILMKALTLREKQFSIPPSVTTIKPQAFRSHSALEEVSIPANVTSIGEIIFASYSAMARVIVAEDNPTYCSMDGALYTKDMTKLIQVPSATPMTSLELPDSITTIEEGACESCVGLTSLRLGPNVKDIGMFAFGGCRNLDRIVSLNPEPPICDMSPFAKMDMNACILYVPQGAKNIYLEDEDWGKFKNIVEIE